MTERFAHDLPFGASLKGETATFRIWAPSADRLTLELDGVDQPMERTTADWHTAVQPRQAGARYRFRMPDGMAFPDPASRQQAGDVHEPSLVVDPLGYRVAAPGLAGRPWHETVIYELHAGAFGGFDGVRAQLPRLQGAGCDGGRADAHRRVPGHAQLGL